MLRAFVTVMICASVLAVSEAPGADPCGQCSASAFPRQSGDPGWSDWTTSVPLGVVASIVNPQRRGGQCNDPDDCAAADCTWWGTAKIYNGGGLVLDNAQILLGGAVVAGGGYVAVGQTVSKSWTQDEPIKASCKKDGDTKATIDFSITWNTITTSTKRLEVTCSKCTSSAGTTE